MPASVTAPLAVVSLAFALAAPVCGVEEIGADDFRISAMGGTGTTSYEAIQPAVAYNAIADEYLVVWAADHDGGVFDNGLWGIFGQRLDAATGAEIGATDFAITGVIDSLGTPFDYSPEVAFNPDQGEYLVVWVGNTGLCCGGDYEVFGRRVSAAGVPLGEVVQISHGADANSEHTFDSLYPAVAYNPDAAEYLVVWSGDDGENGTVDEEFEVRGQRLTAALVPVGADDFRISEMGPLGSTFYDADRPAVVYNGVDHEYLVVWSADSDEAPWADNEAEIFFQRLDGATGAEIGPDDARLSSIGPVGDANWIVFEPAVAHDPVRDEYLVVWTGAESAPAPFTWGLEIFAQRLDATGAEIGADDFRISDVGGVAETFFDAEMPNVVFNPVTETFFVSFRADDDVAGQIDGEIEVLVQEIASGSGAEVGANDDRVSDMGPNGSFQYQTAFPALTVDTTRGHVLVVWRGDDDQGGLADNEWEIFGQRLRAATLFADGFESGDTGAWSSTVP